MPRFDKWLTGVGPEARVPRAARRAIASRLAAVEQQLAKAADPTGRAADDAEAVHQLRIWTRRAAAALRLFRELLPRRRARWLRRKLRQARRTAGKVRDCDVLSQQLASGGLSCIQRTHSSLDKRRKKAQRKLARLHRSLVHHGKLQRRVARLADKVRWRHNDATPQFGPWCREQLRPLCARFFARARADLARDEAIHALRIAGKRLRYAWELASAAVPTTTHRRLYDELSDLQDRLGALCDAMVALEHLRHWRDEADDRVAAEELTAAIGREERRLTARRQRFLRWWTPRRQRQTQRAWERAIGEGRREGGTE